MLLRTKVLAGDIVRPTQLVGGAAGFLSDAITPNMRAVAIRVSSDKIAGGFILPGDRVDVVHTIMRDIDGDGLSNGISNTILRNVRVLAVGAISADRTVSTSTERQDPLASQVPSRVLTGETVTLEVTEEQAGVLFSATERGTLRLSLLALEDHGPTQIGDISHISEATVELTEQQSEPELIPVIEKQVAPTEQSVDGPIIESPRVTIISGGQSISVKVPTSDTSR
jgi:pilus assembly protein CpaB